MKMQSSIYVDLPLAKHRVGLNAWCYNFSKPTQRRTHNFSEHKMKSALETAVAQKETRKMCK